MILERISSYDEGSNVGCRKKPLPTRCIVVIQVCFDVHLEGDDANAPACLTHDTWSSSAKLSTRTACVIKPMRIPEYLGVQI